jgi:hypothetical protein
VCIVTQITVCKGGGMIAYRLNRGFFYLPISGVALRCRFGAGLVSRNKIYEPHKAALGGFFL